MKASELRIGNYIYYNDKEISISAIGLKEFFYLEDSYTNSVIDRRCYAPIQLTKEWLLKFGISFYENKKASDNLYWLKSTGLDWGFVMKRSFEKGKWFFGHEYYDAPKKEDNYNPHWFVFDLKYVHQLQNLYFALTGKELETK